MNELSIAVTARRLGLRRCLKIVGEHMDHGESAHPEMGRYGCVPLILQEIQIEIEENYKFAERIRREMETATK